MSTIQQMADTIETSARDQGATDEMIANYVLASGDLDYVRECLRESGDSLTDWRGVAIAVERAIRRR